MQICPRDSSRSCPKLKVALGETSGTAGCHLRSSDMKNQARFLIICFPNYFT